MNKLSFLPTWFYEFTSSDLLVEQTIEQIKSESMRPNTSNKRSHTDLFFYKDLFEWFESCIISAKKDIGIPDNVGLPITSCWINQATKLQAHHNHNHANSFLSGVYYLTDNHSGGLTNFNTKNIYMKDFEWLRFFENPNFLNVQSFTPKKGTLLLFPSCVKHNVSAVKDSSTRYTISFNTFFSGPIDDSDLKLTRLSFTTKSVRDYYK